MPKAKKVTKVNKVVKDKVEKVKKEKEKKEKVKKEKVKRKPSAYAQFVAKVYHTDEIMALPSKERFKAISVLWKKHKTARDEPLDSKDV